MKIKLYSFLTIFFLLSLVSFQNNLIGAQATTDLTTGNYSFTNRWGFGFKEGASNIVPFYTDDNHSRFGDPISPETPNREFAPAIVNNSTDKFFETDDLHNLDGYYRFYVNNLENLNLIFDFTYGADINNQTTLSSADNYFILYRHNRQGQNNTFTTSANSIVNQFNQLAVGKNTHFEIGSSVIGDHFFKLKNNSSALGLNGLVAFKFTDLLGSSSITSNEVVIKFQMQYKYGFWEDSLIKFAIIVDGQNKQESTIVDNYGPRIYGAPLSVFNSQVLPIIKDTNTRWWQAHETNKQSELGELINGGSFLINKTDGTINNPTSYFNENFYFIALMDYLKNGTQIRQRSPYFSCTFDASPCVLNTHISPYFHGTDSSPIDTINVDQNNYFQTEYWIRLSLEGLYTFNVIEFSGKTSTISLLIDKNKIPITVYQIDGENSSSSDVVNNSSFYQGFGFKYSSLNKPTKVTIKNSSDTIVFENIYQFGEINEVITYNSSGFNSGGLFTVEMIDDADNRGYFNGNNQLLSYSLNLIVPTYNLVFDALMFSQLNINSYNQNNPPVIFNFSTIGLGQWQSTMSNNSNGIIPIAYEENEFRGLKIGNTSAQNTPNQVKLLTKSLIGRGQLADGKPKIKAVLLNLSTLEVSPSTLVSTVGIKVNNIVFANSVKNINSSSNASQDRYVLFKDMNGDIGHLEILINHYRTQPLYIREISFFSETDAALMPVVNFAQELAKYDTCNINDADAAFIELNPLYRSFTSSQLNKINSLLILDYGSQGVAGGKYTLAVTAANKWRAIIDLSEDYVWGNLALSPSNKMENNVVHNHVSNFFIVAFFIIPFIKFKKVFFG